MVLRGRTVAYGIFVVDFRTQKDDKNRTRLTVGRYRIDYPWGVSTLTLGLTTTKILFNSTIPTPGATFIVIDVNEFYINMPLNQYKDMRMELDIISK